MKQKLSTLLVGIIIGAMIFSGAFAVAATVQANTAAFAVSVDGKPIDAMAYEIEGRTYLQLRDIAKALDICLWWDETNRTARLERDKKYDPDYVGPGTIIPSPDPTGKKYAPTGSKAPPAAGTWVWRASNKSGFYHSIKECSGMISPYDLSIEDALSANLNPCSKCWKK